MLAKWKITTKRKLWLLTREKVAKVIHRQRVQCLFWLESTVRRYGCESTSDVGTFYFCLWQWTSRRIYIGTRLVPFRALFNWSSIGKTGIFCCFLSGQRWAWSCFLRRWAGWWRRKVGYKASQLYCDIYADLSSLTVLPWDSRFSAKSHGLTVRHENLTFFKENLPFFSMPKN